MHRLQAIKVPGDDLRAVLRMKEEVNSTFVRALHACESEVVRSVSYSAAQSNQTAAETYPMKRPLLDNKGLWNRTHRVARSRRPNMRRFMNR